MRRAFGALLSAYLFSFVDSARISTEIAEEDVQPQWNFNGLSLGPTHAGPGMGPLIPGLVPPPGTTFEVVNREMEIGVGASSNNYRWAFLTIDQGGNTIPVNQWFAQISGEGFFGIFSGTRRTAVRNNIGQELFIIEASRRSTSTSWRIRSPITDQILFTINKDFFGAGFLGIRDEWRIYRGRERDADPIYYIVADYAAHSHQFFHNSDEYQNSMPPCAQSRFYTRGGTYTQGFASDSIGARVGPGEDTALILSTTIVIDMLNEVRAANQRAANRAAAISTEIYVNGGDGRRRAGHRGGNNGRRRGGRRRSEGGRRRGTIGNVQHRRRN